MSKPPLVTEQTAKRWKLAQLIGVIAIIAGATWLFVAIANRQPAQTPSEEKEYYLTIGKAVAVIAVGVVTWTVGRVGGWWFHG